MEDIVMPDVGEIAWFGTMLTYVDKLAEQQGYSFIITRESGFYISGDGTEHTEDPSYRVEFGTKSFVAADGSEATYPNLKAAIIALYSLANKVIGEDNDRNSN